MIERDFEVLARVNEAERVLEAYIDAFPLRGDVITRVAALLRQWEQSLDSNTFRRCTFALLDRLGGAVSGLADLYSGEGALFRPAGYNPALEAARLEMWEVAEAAVRAIASYRWQNQAQLH
ncbi:hypothetical protein [Roseococcus sp. YIM B11640]|uniref:hypothetical protein n=1 Tax=Roseococcus sp. YIM B11640 TaxID=3133973 RepID=UPI003C7C2F37